jgi:hypothetical protein
MPGSPKCSIPFIIFQQNFADYALTFPYIVPVSLLPSSSDSLMAADDNVCVEAT